jgi:hypothetical protein
MEITLMRSITFGAAALAASLALTGAAFAQSKNTGSNMGNSNTQMKGSGMTQGGMGAQMGEDGVSTRTMKRPATTGTISGSGSRMEGTRVKGTRAAGKANQGVRRPATTGTISNAR